MPCYSRMVASYMPGFTKTGKRPVRFLGKASTWHGPAPVNGMQMPCRQCVGCRLERSRQWATRLLHEAKFHENACFLTLTYDDEHIPKNGSLIRSHFTTFMRDLRARCDYYGKGKVKAFGIGEYGDRSGRPHYHAALYGPFGVTGDDAGRSEEEPSRSGARQFSHVDLSAVWSYGLHRFSELSFESAAYVARYLLKKVTGVFAETHYGDRIPEFQAPSKGLGKAHFEAWGGDVYPSDQVVLPGRGSFLPPPYYDRLLEKADPVLFEKVKKRRAEAHEKMTSSEWFAGVERQIREGSVKRLVVDATLKREGVL